LSIFRDTSVVILLFAGTVSAAAQLAQIYVSNEGNGTLQQLDFATGAITALYQIGVKPIVPDDLTINSAGQLIYSVPNSGAVYLYDPTTGINTELCSGIAGARDLTITPDGQNLLISKYASPAQIWEYNFASNTASVFFPKTAGITTFDGVTFDAYGNLYAVASHNMILQLNPSTGAILATLTLEAHDGINGGDGLTYDSYTNSLWATHDGKVMGVGLLQIPVEPSGFVSTSPGYTFYPLPTIGNVDGIKSDGLGNLYVGAIFSALVYNIPSNTIVNNVIMKGADGVSLVPGTYAAPAQVSPKSSFQAKP